MISFSVYLYSYISGAFEYDKLLSNGPPILQSFIYNRSCNFYMYEMLPLFTFALHLQATSLFIIIFYYYKYYLLFTF